MLNYDTPENDETFITYGTAYCDGVTVSTRSVDSAFKFLSDVVVVAILVVLALIAQ